MFYIEIYQQILIIFMYVLFAFAMTRLINYYILRKVVPLFIVSALLFIAALTLLIIAFVDKNNQTQLIRYSILLFASMIGSIVATIIDLKRS